MLQNGEQHDVGTYSTMSGLLRATEVSGSAFSGLTVMSFLTNR